MTAFSIYKLPEESIVICTLHTEWDTQTDLDTLIDTINDAVQRVKYVTFFILDLSNASFSLDDVIGFSNAAARGDDGFAHHHNMRRLIFVSPHPMIPLTAEGMRTATFGNAPVYACETLDEALEVARSMMRG